MKLTAKEAKEISSKVNVVETQLELVYSQIKMRAELGFINALYRFDADFTDAQVGMVVMALREDGYIVEPSTSPYYCGWYNIDWNV
jgi:hypothetical protein